MPIIPPIQHGISGATTQIPQTDSLRATPADYGAQVGFALQDAGASLTDTAFRLQDIRARRQRKSDEEAADRALTTYTSDMDALLHGTTDPATGAAVPGLLRRQAGEAKGTATDYAAKEKEWFNTEGGTFATLTPEQQRIFQERAAPLSSRLRTAAVDHELSQTSAQKDLDRKAAYSAKETLADHFLGTPDYVQYKADAVQSAGDLAAGPGVTVNPDGSRAYASPAHKALAETAMAEAYTKLTLREADHFTRLAENAPLDPSGEEIAKQHLAQAERAATELPPPEAAKVREAALQSLRIRTTRAHALKADADQAARDMASAQIAQIDTRYLDSAVKGHPDTATTIAQLHALSREATDPQVIAHATTRIEHIQAFDAARAKAAKETSEQQDKTRDDTIRNEKLAGFKTGFATDPKSGQPVPLAPAEIIAAAEADFRTNATDSITYDQYKEVVSDAAKMQDARVARFSERAIREVLPKFTAGIVRDKSGNFTLADPSQKAKTTQGVAIRPDFATGYTDRFSETDLRKNREIKRERDVLLSEAVDALNVVKDRLATDPKMTPDDAAELYKSMITGTSLKADQLTLRDTLAEHQRTASSISLNLRRAAMLLTTPPPKP